MRHPIIHKIQSPSSRKNQHTPHLWVAPLCRSRQHQTPKEDSKSPLLNKDGTQRVRSITGAFLHYGRSVNPYILPDLNEIASEQDNPTTDTLLKLFMIMDYLYTNPEAIICYHTSDKILKIVSDTAFLILTEAQS